MQSNGGNQKVRNSGAWREPCQSCGRDAVYVQATYTVAKPLLASPGNAQFRAQFQEGYGLCLWCWQRYELIEDPASNGRLEPVGQPLFKEKGDE